MSRYNHPPSSAALDRMEHLVPELRRTVVRAGRRRRIVRAGLAGGVLTLLGFSVWLAWPNSVPTPSPSHIANATPVIPPETPTPAHSPKTAPPHHAPAVTPASPLITLVSTDTSIVKRLSGAPPVVVQIIDDAQVQRLLAEANQPAGLIRIEGRTTWEGELALK